MALKYQGFGCDEVDQSWEKECFLSKYGGFESFSANIHCCVCLLYQDYLFGTDKSLKGQRTKLALRFSRVFEHIPRGVGEIDEIVELAGTAQP
jgi:hypothetical protein